MSPEQISDLMNAAAVKRTITRLAHEILEKNDGPENIVLVGIQTRGEPLAYRLQSLIKQFAGIELSVGSVDITFHRDDFRDRLVMPQVKGSEIPFSIDDKTVILIDDVLFTGRTIRAAIDVLMSYGRPERIQLAVLVDRGHREMPIRADFVGKNIPTHEGEHVNVLLQEIDEQDRVQLVSFKREGI